MAKLILLAMVLFTTIVPIALSGGTAPRRTLRTIQLLTVVAAFIWAYACRTWYPQLVWVE